ncbi:toll/interleukin-1 receptor domain-containing adapter protein [Sebastes umbrosus]|uniref:toll/interleukin-1 receptor domain-containing adapter protein n=1 Tax=Sebastes umbrosus TaxID=72105 RepID=UPI0018A125CD|nr:toll/interleukin-1 receptor domain-containing adapter protein [Sebastes umbrosus]
MFSWGLGDSFKRVGHSTFISWKDFCEALNRHNDDMHGWIQKLLKSRVSSSAQCEQEAKVTKKSVSSVSSVSPSSTSSCSSSSSSSLGTTPSKPLQPQSALSSLLRWSQKYDVFVCHSSVHSDIEEAVRLVSFLEASPRSLRCFLMQRDACPGGAISTELCQAVQNSHLKALLITPNFLQDDWCKYMMHQVLAEAPMSNRIIPLIQNLSHSQYPQELRFYFYIDLSRNPDQGYTLINKAVLKYLEDLVKKEKTLDCNMDN